MKPTAYEHWLYKVSEGDKVVLEHLITNDLISGNEYIFNLLEEAGEDVMNENSMKNVTEYLTNKIENYETGSKRLGTRI
jgi:hypothetical protein